MPTIRRLLALSLLLVTAASAQATFSIVAVDPVTGEVGSAGASCISGSIILSDVHPGVGVIHTQSYWNAANQNNARNLMNEGWSPQEIIDWLVANDAQGNPSIRQYGIVDLVDGGRTAAYTGVNCFDWKGHILGPTYAIQGNILLNADVIADMEAAFLATAGQHLAFRLMAALQGANIPGADERCLDDDKPAISAFVRLAKPDDTAGDFFLDLNVNNTAPSQNPIDILQEQFDAWVPTALPAPPAEGALVLHAPRPNPFNPATTLSFTLPAESELRLSVHDLAGRELEILLATRLPAGPHEIRWSAPATLSSGVYLLRLRTGDATRARKLVLIK